MPSGRTHDSITFFLAVPVWIGIWKFTGSVALATLSAAAFLFGGLMFGPDLDTRSVQYGRWRVFKVIWFPYRFFFKHRSFWTHGLIFGTLLRVVYFLGVITILGIGAVFIASFLTTGTTPDEFAFIGIWRDLGDYLRSVFGPRFFYVLFGGLWIGAASHSLTDWALSYIKTGKP